MRVKIMKHEKLMKRLKKKEKKLDANFLKIYQLMNSTNNKMYKPNIFKQGLLHQHMKNKSKNIEQK